MDMALKPKFLNKNEKTIIIIIIIIMIIMLIRILIITIIVIMIITTIERYLDPLGMLVFWSVGHGKPRGSKYLMIKEEGPRSHNSSGL